MNELMDREQFHCGDAEPGEIFDSGRVGQASVGSSLRLGDAGVPGGEALDVQFIDDRLVQRDIRGPVATPVEKRVVDHCLGHVGGAVIIVA